MPGWHAATRAAQEAGRLTLLGIVLEQHPQRARLFMQWQRMPWRLLHDPYNLLALPYVPLTLAIDEWGVIRAAQPALARADELIARFAEAELQPLPAPPPATITLTEAAQLALWKQEAALDEALALGEATLARQQAQQRAQAHFEQGVIYRMRHDSPYAQAGDFRRAVDHWAAALRHDPNNYIWRRRIQQYGPRLAKPYSFYDWVPQARTELLERGETPLPLSVEPGGAEFAYPETEFNQGGAEFAHPAADSDGANGSSAELEAEARIFRDEAGELARLQVVAVPPALAPGEAARLHFLLRPSGEAHWNNESEPLRIVLDEGPPGWQWQQRRLSAPMPAAPVSAEPRHLEVELRAPLAAPPGAVRLSGYALYHACAEASGVCLYRRQDFSLELALLPADSDRLQDPGPPRPGTRD